MRRGSLALASLLLLAAVLVPGGTAWASGAGLHVREADRLLELLAAEDPVWAERAALPLGPGHLRLGSISPDFQWLSDELSFGHSTGLSFHLLEAAGEDPLRQLFALGHLAHQASDAAGEGFVLPTLFGSAPLGLFDLFDGEDDALGESEGIVEGFGDLSMGDWPAVVDVLYDFWMEDEAVRPATRTLLLWYCEEGAAFEGRATDCDRVVEQIAARLDQVESFLGALDRAEAQAFVGGLLGSPLEDLTDVFATGVMALLGGEVGAPSDIFAFEIERFRHSALTRPEFWDQYEAMADLGPRFALDRFLHRPEQRSWPGWNANAIVCGNLHSVMQFLPQDFSVTPGLLVDSLQWETPAGEALTEVPPELDGSAAQVRVRLFSTLPFAGRLRGVVRKDRAGLDTQQDESLGEATLDLEVEPTLYQRGDRSTLVVPFTVDLAAARGFVFELYVGDAAGPTFTTSWDRLWTVGGFPLDRPGVLGSFGTYGHWPPSLPASEPAAELGALLVRVHVAPAGPGVEGATVELDPGGQVLRAGPNGQVVFPALEPGTYHLQGAAEGYLPLGDVSVDLAGGEERRIDLALHALPRVASPVPYWDPAVCAAAVVDPAPFAGQAVAFETQLWSVADDRALGPAVDLDPVGRGRVCPSEPLADGSAVELRARARYADDSTGPEGTSEPFVVDASPPAIEVPTWTEAPSIDCVADPASLPYRPPVLITVPVTEPHSPLTSLRWRLGATGAWTDQEAWVPPARPRPGRQELRVRFEPAERAGDAELSFEVGNAAGGVSISEPIALPVWGADRLCPEPDPDLGVSEPDLGSPAPDAGPPDADLGSEEADLAPTEPDLGPPSPSPSDGGAGGGCQVAAGAPPAAALRAVLPLLLGRRPRMF